MPGRVMPAGHLPPLPTLRQWCLEIGINMTCTCPCSDAVTCTATTPPHTDIFSLYSDRSSWIVTVIYFMLFCLVGFAYVASLRQQIQRSRHPFEGIDLDKRLSLYVYALPVLCYTLMGSLLHKGFGKSKCDMCMLGLVSGLAIALYKKPASHAFKLVVWVHYQRLQLWVASPRESLRTVQERIAEALGVLDVSRVCFNTQAAHEYAADLSSPLFSLFGDDPIMQHDFFGFPVLTCHVSVQTLEAYQQQHAALLKEKEEHSKDRAHVSKRHQLMHSLSTMFSKKGALPTSSSTPQSDAAGARSPKSSPSPKSDRDMQSLHLSSSNSNEPLGMADRMSIGHRMLDERLEVRMIPTPIMAPN